MFDCRAVEYPNEKVVMDYFAWRQVDTHINNQVSKSISRNKKERVVINMKNKM